jgi:type IV secretory pathway TrbD component
MRQAVSTQPTHAHLPRLTLNSDGRRHPLLNATTAFTFFAGIAAFALGLVVRTHLAATVLGLATFAIGLYAQLVSATREQRIFIVTGLVGAFVGMGLGIAHGGFG